MTFYAFIDPKLLKHIESYSEERVDLLTQKIEKEGVWTRPICICNKSFLIMDGQHRRQVGLRLQLSIIPCVLIDYKSIKIESLHEGIEVSLDNIYSNYANDIIYPYKTVKHYFNNSIFENYQNVSLHHLRFK